MNYFPSPTQYDKAYLGIDNNRSVCSFFSLHTVSEFINNGDTSPEKHLSNLDISVANYLKFGINQHLSFYELLEGYTTSHFEKDVMATSQELIISNTVGYDHIFDSKKDGRYGVILLKNSKYFVILVDPKKVYYVRDCHSSVQYNFSNREDLIEHLQSMYEFETNITVTDPDGTSFVVGDFNNIEFLIVDKPVASRFDLTIHAPKYDEDMSYDDFILKQVMDESLKDSNDADSDLLMALTLQTKEWDIEEY